MYLSSPGRMRYLKVLFLGLLVGCISSWRESENTSWMCPGQPLKSGVCHQPNSVLKVISLTVYSGSNASAIEELGEKCRPLSPTIQCQRAISSTSDSGVSEQYKYFYDWVISKCEGKRACDTGRIPQWFELTGQTNLAASLGVGRQQNEKICPRGGIKYISGVLLATECRVGEPNIVTAATLPTTTQRTRPTEPSTTTPFPVSFYIYMPQLGAREKIILAIVIALAATILTVLLLILYCWDRWKRHKRLGKLLRMLGKPQEKDDELDELKIYGTPDAWRDESNHDDALAEFSGVKPKEYLTIDAEQSGLVYCDQLTTFTTSMSRQNTASTLRKDGASRCHGPEFRANPAMTYIDYTSADNIELERRMATDLYRVDSANSCYSLQRF